MRDVQLYYEAVNELLGELMRESIVADEKLNALMDDRFESARVKENTIYQVNLEKTVYQVKFMKLTMARDRLKRLRSINPPNGAATIHKIFLKAFVLGVEARQQEIAGNHVITSATYKLASREVDRGNKMWDELGVKRYP